MDNKINISELLKDCPKGMELDCTMFDNVTFVGVDIRREEFPIEIKVGIVTKYLTKEGCYHRLDFNPSAKCVIFPKGKTTWEGFQRPFKDGDILSYQCGGLRNRSIYIYRHHSTMNTSYYVALGDGSNFMVGNKKWNALNGYNTTARLATEEEKAILFQAIKDNGYNWNPETKTLEKLPKFKVGDRVKHISACTQGIVVKVSDKGYHIDYPKGEGICYVNFTLEKDYELVPNKFDINTLVPFESKVLVRNDNEQRWIPAFWGGKREDGYVTTFGWGKYCIPYEGNEHLLDKTDDCDEYYKTWE